MNDGVTTFEVIREDGTDSLVAVVRFNIGEIANGEKRVDANGNTYLTLGMVVKTMKSALLESLQNNFYLDMDILEEYCKLWLMDRIGVQQFPIRRKGGMLLGLAEDAIINDVVPLDEIIKRGWILNID